MIRDEVEVDPDAAREPIFVLATDRSSAPLGDSGFHRHRRAQLFHTRATSGAVVVRTHEGRWLVPPTRGIWIPAGVLHTHETPRRRDHADPQVALLTAYVAVENPLFSRTLAKLGLRVVAVDRLLDALLEAAAIPDDPADPARQRLLRVLGDRLEAALELPAFHLPMPPSPRLRRIAHAFLADPQIRTNVSEIARQFAMTERTFSRHFFTDTGMTFGRWCQQARLLFALELLHEGASVTEIAGASGYEDISSFISAFKAIFGTTPKQYLRANNH